MHVYTQDGREHCTRTFIHSLSRMYDTASADVQPRGLSRRNAPDSHSCNQPDVRKLCRSILADVMQDLIGIFAGFQRHIDTSRLR